MKILLLGGTGRLGRQITQQALDRNLQTNALVRDPAKVNSENSNLKIIQGTPEKKQDIESALAGCNAIINTLNISRTSDFPWAKLRAPERLISTSIQYLIELMPKYEIERIVTVSAWGANDSFANLPGWFKWLIRNSNMGAAYRDHERQEDLLVKTNLQWTIVRPAGLTNSEKIKELIVSIDGHPRPSWTISRKHLAKFLLDTVEENLYVRQIAGLSER